MDSKKDLGKKGEVVAAKLLQREGYKILARNFNSRFGEIDIVAQEGDTLVFVEVKTRWSQQFGAPEEAITPRKLKSIEKAGQMFRIKHPSLPEAERIDVVAIEIDEDGKVIRKELIKNASG
jgi:putative endonuclease